MGRKQRIVAAVVALIVIGPMGGLAMSATVAQAAACQSPAGRYDVTPPRAAPSSGADPAEVGAANCTLGFHENQAYPLSVIALCILASLGVVVLLRRGTSYEPVGSEAEAA